MNLISFKIVILFNTTSADIKTKTVEKYHNFERNEDRATVFLKWTDFSRDNIIGSAALLDLPLWHESILALAQHSSTHYHENSTQIDGNPLLN